jgi:pimeloyl-ACP methyl ester carboxylesterase
MRRSTFIGAGVAAAAVAASGTGAFADETEYDLTTATGTLYGTLALPASTAPVPVALIIAGSGPVDRDGNAAPQPALNYYRKLAAALAAQGIASLRYDKRGIAASHAAGPPEAAARFGMYADDAAAWAAKLHADKRFSHVGAIGHSEGSLLGMLAAQHAPIASFISLEGAGFPIATVLRTQLASRLQPYPDLAKAAESILATLESGKTVADVPPPLANLFRPSVQPYLISWMAYDPRVEIAKLRGRVTIVQGTHDAQVPVADGQALAAARPSATLALIDGMTHVLTDDPATTLDQQLAGAYADATRPLDATMVASVIKGIA